MGDVTLVREDGSKHYFLLAEPATIRIRAMPVSFQVTRAGGTVEEHHPADPVREWLEVAVRNPAVAKALRLRDKGGLDWVELYRLYEVIESDTPQAVIVRNGWATKAVVRRFKHTANSPAVLGDRGTGKREAFLQPIRWSFQTRVLWWGKSWNSGFHPRSRGVHLNNALHTNCLQLRFRQPVRATPGPSATGVERRYVPAEATAVIGKRTFKRSVRRQLQAIKQEGQRCGA